MSWIYLLIASIFEVGWPFGFKMASLSNNKVLWILFAVISMIFSGYFLYVAQKNIPIGTAYIIWTGIGAICTFLLGVYAFHDSINCMKILGIAFILCGIGLLKVAH